MKTLLLTLIGIAGSMGLFGNMVFSENGDNSIEGIWLTRKGDSKIQIKYNAADKTYSGKLIWVVGPYKEFTGEQILKDITYRKDSDSFDCPWIYDPRLGITASGTATVSGDTLYLKARKGVFTKSEIFTKENSSLK